MTRCQGSLLEKDGTTYFFYEESHEEAGSTRTRITLNGSHLKVERRGVVETVLEYHLGRYLEGPYATPFGSFTVGTETTGLTYEKKKDGALLRLSYRISMNGEDPRDASLEIHATYL